jgi:hypothetical protein
MFMLPGRDRFFDEVRSVSPPLSTLQPRRPLRLSSTHLPDFFPSGFPEMNIGTFQIRQVRSGRLNPGLAIKRCDRQDS